MSTGKKFVDGILSQLANGHRPFGHVNEQILLPLKVSKPIGSLGSFDASNLRIVSGVKAPEGKTPTVTMHTTIGAGYTLLEKSIKAMASDKQAENQELPFNEQKDVTEFVTDLLSVAREYGLASVMNAVGTFTNNTTLSGTGQWGGSADDPIGDINTALNTVEAAIAIPREMLSLVIPSDVFTKLVFLPEIMSTLGFNQKQTTMVRPAQLAASFNVRQVIVPNGFYNSAEDGQADVMARMWGKHAWAVYIPTAPRRKERPFGWTVKRKQGIVIDKFRDEDVRGWWIRATDEVDQYIQNETAAYMIEDAIA